MAMRLIGGLVAAIILSLLIGWLVSGTGNTQTKTDTAVVAGSLDPVIDLENFTPEPLPTEPVDISITYGDEFYYGSSTLGHQLTGYTYGSGEKTIVFVGGIHGGYEWNTILLAERLRQYLLDHPEDISADVRVVIIPNANPDGLGKIVKDVTRFTTDEIPADTRDARFNARGVDLNRNFDCQWQPEATWGDRTVDAGDAAFSEIESAALKNYFELTNPDAVVFWHSAAGGVYDSQCGDQKHPDTTTLAQTYAIAANYPHFATFDSYPVTGDAGDWLATIGIPAITVELTTHDSIEWAKNLAGSLAAINFVAQ